MAFEITKLRKKSSPTEIDAFSDFAKGYFRETLATLRRCEGMKINVEGASEELAGYYVDHCLNQISNEALHGLLAFNTKRNDRQRIIPESFKPLGHMLFRTKYEKRGFACIEQIAFDEDAESWVEILLMHRFMEEVGRLCQKNNVGLPRYVEMKTLPRETTNIAMYNLLGFDLKGSTEGKLLWQAEYPKIALR